MTSIVKKIVNTVSHGGSKYRFQGGFNIRVTEVRGD